MRPNLQTITAWFARGAYTITTHGSNEMGKDNVSVLELEWCLIDDEPEIIEEYPDDPRGPCCLILAWNQVGRPVHTCVGYGGTRPLVITVYRPDLEPARWENGFNTRRD